MDESLEGQLIEQEEAQCRLQSAVAPLVVVVAVADIPDYFVADAEEASEPAVAASAAVAAAWRVEEVPVVLGRRPMEVLVGRPWSKGENKGIKCGREVREYTGDIFLCRHEEKIE